MEISLSNNVKIDLTNRAQQCVLWELYNCLLWLLTTEWGLCNLNVQLPPFLPSLTSAV